MVFIVEKHVFLLEHYLKTESFRTTQSDYSHQFGCPAPAKSVMWKSVKHFTQTGNVNILKYVHQSAGVTEICITWKVIQHLLQSNKDIAVVSIQNACYSEIVNTRL
jgi:hypothetical protein